MKKHNKKIPAVILGMSANGLSIARSLGSRGITVVGVSADKEEPGMYSRYLARVLIAPNVIYKEKEFLDFLISLGREFTGKAVLCATSDEYIAVVSKYREELLRYFYFLLPPHELITALLDKKKSYLLAEEKKLLYPDTYFVDNEEELKKISATVSYPCVIKPRLSHLFRERYGKKKAFVVSSPEELRRQYHSIKEHALEVFIQQIVPGPDTNLFEFMAYCDKNGTPAAYCCCRKLRQYPCHFGIGSFLETVKRPDVIEAGLDFLKKINYQGHIEVEFKINEQIKKPIFIEANPRTSFVGEISVAAGIDLPYIDYRNLVYGDTRTVHKTFREGVKLLNFELDIGSFKEYWRNKEITVIQWLKTFRAKKIAHTYFSVKDIKPFLIVYKRFLLRVFKKIFTRKRTSELPPAVVLGMSANGLSVVRSYGRKGIPVIGLDDDKKQPGMFSRYCTHMQCPDVLKEERSFMQYLIDIGKKLPQKGILFITGDQYLPCISKNRGILSSYFKFTLPDEWIIDSFIDKRKSYRLVEKYGIHCPETHVVDSLDDLKKIMHQVRYPCALKPAYSHIWKITYGGKKLIQVNSPDELYDSYAHLAKEGQQVMVQEIIPGKDSDIYCVSAYFNRQHQPLAVFTKRKLRQYPIHFGISSFGISERNEMLGKTVLNFLLHIKYTGIAGIEFKYDSRDKQFKFFENNMRTLMSGELAVASGADFPYIYYQDLTGREIEYVDHFKEGIKLVNLELDIASLWHYWKLKELTLYDWIRSFRGEIHHTYFAWDDLFPFLFVCFRFISTLIRKIASISLWRRTYDSEGLQKNRQNILHLVSSTGLFGKEHSLIELVRVLHAQATPVTVGVISNPGNSHKAIVEALYSLKLPFVQFNCTKKFDLKTIRSIRSFIKDNGIAIVHGHGYKSNIYGFLATLLLPVKCVATVHNWIRSDVKLKTYAFIDKIILRRFDGIAVVSEQVKKEIHRYGIDDDKVFFINNGIDQEKFNISGNVDGLKQSLGINGKEKIVGSIGRLSDEKGLTYLLGAVKYVTDEITDVRFLIIGKGPLEEDLKSMAKKLGIEHHVIFTGMRSDIPKLLHIMDVFALPSIVEAMPMALLEAMASKKPVVATRVGSVPALVKDNETGLLVKPGDARDLGNAIIALLKDFRRASALANNGFNLVKKNFSSREMAEQYVRLYRSLAEKRGQ